MSREPLNEAQKIVVNHNAGELLVVAGAGTGKTKTIVERIAKLIDSGVHKQGILALTFTEKAAHEMLDRVSELVRESYGVELAIHTFNAFGQLLIEEFAVEVGLNSKQKLVGEDGRIVFMREHFDSFELDYFAPASNPNGQLVTLADYFSELKQQLVLPKQYLSYAKTMPQSDTAEKLERKKHIELANAYATYIKLMRKHNVIDYDDQIFLALHILKQRPNVLAKLRSRYKHIMVDEFQDTNPMQSELIDMLYGKNDAEKNKSLVVVGDDDQAIYEWRGATLGNILDFTNRYPKAGKVALIKNYRSTQAILDSAWHLIQQNNPNRLESIEGLNKRLIAANGNGQKPQACEFETQQEELYYVAEQIKCHVDDAQSQVKLPSIAVLTRSKRLAKLMHDVLTTVGVQHTVAGLGEDMYQQQIITVMLDALSTVWQPKKDNGALYHTLVGRLFLCDPVIVAEAAYDARTRHVPLFDVLSTCDDKDIINALELIDSWHKLSAELTVRKLSYTILEQSGLKNTLYTKAISSTEIEKDVLILSQWFESLSDFEAITTTPSVYSYLENLPVLRAEGEVIDDSLEVIDGEPVVMTMHRSKGLEWDNVFVIGANERSFPYLGGGSSLKIPDILRRSTEADSRIYEERRLMYVAVTRARKNLTISHSKSVTGGKSTRKPSRFIEELQLTSIRTTTENVTKTFDNHITETIISRIGLPRNLTDGEYIVLTASQAEDYIYCPLNFYYKHVLHVPDISGPETEVGSLIHDLIQKINDAKRLQVSLPEKHKLISELESRWPQRGYTTKKQRDLKLHQARSAFKNLYDRLVEEDAPLAVEESFRLKIPGSFCILRGRFDAVVPYEKGVEIHDYKTNTSVSSEDKAKSKVRSSDQLTMYAVAWRLLNGVKPDTVALNFVLTGHVGRMKKQDKSLDTMEHKLAEIAEKIKAMEFPEGQKHDYCIHP